MGDIKIYLKNICEYHSHPCVFCKSLNVVWISLCYQIFIQYYFQQLFAYFWEMIQNIKFPLTTIHFQCQKLLILLQMSESFDVFSGCLSHPLPPPPIPKTLLVTLIDRNNETLQQRTFNCIIMMRILPPTNNSNILSDKTLMTFDVVWGACTTLDNEYIILFSEVVKITSSRKRMTPFLDSVKSSYFGP